MTSRVNPFKAFLDGSNKSSAQDSVSNANNSEAPNDAQLEETATPYANDQTPAEAFDQAMFDQALYGDDTAEAYDNSAGETAYDQTAYDQTTCDQTAAEAYNETSSAAAYDNNAAEQQYEGYYPATEPAPESVEYGENNNDNGNADSDGWVQYIDDESGLPYWYNEYTGESRWVEVESAEQAEAPIQIKGVWEKYYDDDGNPFYYNTETGQSDWEIPADAILSTGFASEPVQDTFKGMWMGEEEDTSVAGSTSRKYPPATSSSMKRMGSIKSIRSARSFGLQRPNGASNKFTSFSEKVVMIEDQTGQITSRSLKSIKSSASFRLQRVPSVADNLKPKVPIKRKAKNGFQMLKEGATVLREATDPDGVLWMELQSADDGPIFYATEDPESGQWGRPPAFDLLDSPNPKSHRDTNGSASPSDSSLEASNEVVDFFLLDKDEALKIISPSLARLPSSNGLTSGDVPIAMREETTTTSSLASPVREPLFAGRPPLSARRTEKEGLAPSTDPLSPLSLSSSKSPKPRSANVSIAHSEKTPPQQSVFNEEQEEKLIQNNEENIAKHQSPLKPEKEAVVEKDDSQKENNDRSLSLSSHNQSSGSKSENASKENELARMKSNETFESFAKRESPVEKDSDALKPMDHSPQPPRQHTSLLSSPSLLSTDSMLRDVSLAESVSKKEKSVLSEKENGQPKDPLPTEKPRSVHSSHNSLLTTQSSVANTHIKTEKSVTSHNTATKDESTMDKLGSIALEHAEINNERPIALHSTLSKDVSLMEKSRSVNSSHSSLSAVQASSTHSQPKPESARTNPSSAQASAERTPSKTSVPLSSQSSAEKSNDRSNLSQGRKENKDTPIVPPLSLPQQTTTPVQAPLMVDSETSAILSPLTLAESFQEEEHSLSTKKENDVAQGTATEHAVASSTSSVGAAHTGPPPSSVVSPAPSISSAKKEATSAFMLSIQEEAKAELERLRNRLETAKVAFSATHPVSVEEENSEPVPEESASAKSCNEAETSLKAISTEMANNSFVDPVSASLFISAISEGEDIIAKDIDLIANHSPNDSLFELDDIIFSPAKKTTNINIERERETKETAHSSPVFGRKSDSSNDHSSSSQPKSEDAKTNSFLPFSPLRSAESPQKAVKFSPSAQPGSIVRPHSAIPSQSSVAESQEPPESFEDKKKFPPISYSNEPVVKATSNKEEWLSRSPTKAWATVEEEPATPIVGNIDRGSDGSNDSNGNKFTDFFDFTMVPDMFSRTNLTVDLAKVEQSSLSKLHALLRREDQFQEDEAQVFLQRLQALNTSTRTNLRGFANPLSEMDTSELRKLRLRMRSLLERCCRVLDRTEASHTELVMNERQLFRAAVYQRQFLQHEVRDLLHDAHFLRFSPDACLFASSLAFRELWTSLSTRRHPVNSETQSLRLSRERIGSWMCFSSGNSDKNSSLVFCQPDLRIVQRGEPFDIGLARRATRLTRESWSDYIVNALVDQRKLEAQGVELLRDEFGGFLFFCPLRKSYSSTGLFGGSLRTQAQRAVSSLPSHHSWSEKYASSKMHRLMQQQQRQRARDDQNETRPSDNVWERFPGLELCFTAESDEGPLPRSSLSPSTSLRDSAFSSGKALAPSPSESLRSSLEACREEFKSSQRGTQSFFLSQMHEDDHDDSNERENEDKGKNAMRDVDQGHWQILQSAFAVAEEDITATLRLADTRSTVGTGGDAMMFSSHNNSTKGGETKEDILREKQARNALRFEAKMDIEDYEQYANKLVAVFENDPDNALPLLELVELLIYRGLGKQALAALKQATDVLRVSPFYAESSEVALELALCRVLSVQLSEKYFHFFERTEALIMLTHLHSESPALLTHVAALFARQQRFDFAETLLLAALLQDPHYELALLRFADLLSRQGDLQSAIKFLRRISDKTSTIGRSAVLHEAWLQELQWVFSPSPSIATDGSAFVCTAYRECFQSAVKRDHTQSLGLHSLASFSLSLLSSRAQSVEYLQRALQCDPDNAMATFTLSALSTVFHTLRRVSVDSFRSSSLTQENVPQSFTPPANALSGTKRSAKTKKTKKQSSKNKTTEISSGDKTNKIETTATAATAFAECSLSVNPFALSNDENVSLFLSLEETDSAFRRSLVLFASDALFWLPMLTYADFLHLTMRDTQRAREYYEAAVRRSLSIEIEPIIALSQFLQYTLNDYCAVEELLMRSLRSRCASRFSSLEEFVDFFNEERERERERERESKRGEEDRDDLITECDTNDLLVLYTLVAHFLWDTKRVAAAQRFALAALRLHVSFSPALRLLGLLCFFEGERDKNLAGKYFAAATNAAMREEASKREDSTDEGVRKSPLQRALMNVATMKCEALSLASRHRYDQAIALFEKALSLSASPCVVSCHSLAVLLYAYKGRSERALSLLQRAFEASRGEDIASLRLKAQILMDCMEYDEARLCLQEVLKRVPCDPISLTNLAWCQLRRRGKKTTRSRSSRPRSRPTTAGPTKSDSLSDFDVFGSILLSKEERDNQKAKKKESRFTADTLTPARLQSLAHSQDPDELFAAARATATILCNGGERDYNTGLRCFSLNVSPREPLDLPTTARLSHSGNSVCAYVSFWEALYHLQESESCVFESDRLIAREHAKTLFTMASSTCAAQTDLRESRARVSPSSSAFDKPKSSPETRTKRKRATRNETFCVLGKYFLAMITEASGDFSLAEKLLREALAVATSSNNPILFLRLLRLLESSLMEARTSLRYFQKNQRMDPSLSGKIKSSSKSTKKFNPSSSPADLLFSRSDLDPLRNGFTSESLRLPTGKQSDAHDPSRSLPFFSPKRDLFDTLQSNGTPHSGKKKRHLHQPSSMLDLQSERENADDDEDSPSMERKELIATEDLLLENELDIAQSQSKSDEEDEAVSHEMNNLIVRVLMHQRVLEAALLKKYSLEKTCKEVSQNLPSKTFVYLDEDWIESSLYSLGKCEDWSTLLLSTGDCLL